MKPLACTLLSLLILITPSIAKAPKPYEVQKIKYDVYASGFQVLDANMEMNYATPGRYFLMFDARTHGFLKGLVPWSGGFSAEGWVLKGRKLVTQIHESVSNWREEHETKTYKYAKDGSFIDLTTLYKGKKPKTVVPEKHLTKDSTDALTAALLVFEKVSDGKNCEGESIVFDGKRRFKIVFSHVGFVMLEKTRYNAYSGPAAECTMEVVPVEGAWHEKPRGWFSIQEQGRKKGELPTLWLAQVSENAVVVPVRIRVKTDYGTLFVHMTSYESGEKILKVE